MKVKGLTPHYGAKRSQATGIIEALGPHHAYYEPFGGSAAVLFAKPRARQEVFNDLHLGLTTLARVVQDDHLAPRLFERCYRTAFSEALYKDSVSWLKKHQLVNVAFRDSVPGEDEFALQAAYHYFVASWMTRGGLVGTTRELDTGFSKRFSSSGGDSAVRFKNAVASIPDWWERLRGVTILNEDAFGLLPRIEDGDGVAIYVDSPYLVKEVDYVHDFEPNDHARLAAALGRFQKTRVVVSYYHSPLLDDLYPASRWRRLDKFTKKQMGNGKKAAPEVLYVLN